jgi:hypothetical protein
MNIEEVKETGQTGDILMVHGYSPAQNVIQSSTSSAFCHVALLVRTGIGLLVSEMVEGVGYQCMTIDDWASGRPGEDFFFGQAPESVRSSSEIIASLSEYTDPSKREYGYFSLPLVWLSQFTGKEYGGREVCSLFCQHRWELAGLKIDRSCAPGDFLFLCESISLIH